MNNEETLADLTVPCHLGIKEFVIASGIPPRCVRTDSRLLVVHLPLSQMYQIPSY